MSNRVKCPVCQADVTHDDINVHLDNGCQSSTRQKQSSSKLAPIFSSSLGKRGTNARTADSSQTIVADDEEEDRRAQRKRAKVENAAPAPIFQLAKASAKAAKQPGGQLSTAAPLAEKLRPHTFDDFVGQDHLVGEGSLFLSLVESRALGSIILWGPPGCGKTTLARLLATKVDASFKELSATNSGLADVKAIFDEAKRNLKLTGTRTILFMDEIQRFNKAQQDIFLPYVENGWITLVGATTENPSFKINGALLSRCRVFVLERLSNDEITTIVKKAIMRASGRVGSLPGADPLSSAQVLINLEDETQDAANEAATTETHEVSPAILNTIVNLSAGDARTALSLLELVLSSAGKVSESSIIASLRRSVSSRFDRSGDDRYDMISALHKSLRGSDGSAALYWLARMLTGGEDPLYVARRLIVVASEDVGLADNHALPLAVATYSAVQSIGMPECRINLAHCVAYLAEAPKSTRAYEGYKRAEEAAKADPTIPVPLHLRNAPTSMMKEMQYGEGYLYNPSYRHPVYQEYLPGLLTGAKLLYEEGDMTDKTWDEDALLLWEWRGNGGNNWVGREVSKEDVSKGLELTESTS